MPIWNCHGTRRSWSSASRARLIVLVGMLVLALVVIGALGLRGMAQSKDGLQTVYQVSLRDLKVIADLYAVNIVDTTHKVRDGIISWLPAGALTWPSPTEAAPPTPVP